MAIVVSVTHEGHIPPSTVTDYPQATENCNMFNAKALEESLQYITVHNYWSLYDIQKRRIGMFRLDVKFSEFTQEYRLVTETQNRMYSKRYVYYVPIQFITYPRRKDYKRSEYYNVPVNFTTISNHKDIYDRNVLVFIEGRFISTVNILPLEDKTCIIIDVASSNDKNGIPLNKFNEYKEKDSIVTMLFIPNFSWSRYITNRYAMVNNKYTIPFSKFNQGELITPNSIMLINTMNDIKNDTSLRRPITKYNMEPMNKRYVFDGSILTEFSDTEISDADDMISSYDFLVLSFEKLFKIINVDDSGYFKIIGKMPCPRENMIVFSVLKNGNIVFDHNVDIELFYPNIYHVCNSSYSDCTYLVYCFYEEISQNESEEYFNQISLYEEYVNLLEQHMLGKTPEILKEWQPLSYDYNESDYNITFTRFYIPRTLFYKIFKMYDTISKDPWALNAYLKFLTCPSEKYYIDVTKISLEKRLRNDTTPEPIVKSSHYTFSEPYYVFAMNRRFLKKSRYDFRIWVDGLFLRNEFYHMELGLDYYYIYIPTKFIHEDSMIEIERHKLFDFHTEYTFTNISDWVELSFDDDLVTAYAHDVYIVDKETNLYVDKSMFYMTIFSESLSRWTKIDPDSFCILSNRKVRIYPKNDTFVGVPLQIGIHKGANMSTSEPYDKDKYYIGEWAYVETVNHGNYKSSDYRVFNNGKLLLPIQWQMEWTNKYGGVDTCRTNWALSKGDQITIDHVPCNFRTVFYQADIPSDGLIDVDGKLNLPVNLKWYDIYLNGKRLTYKNIDIVSPTKFYIKNVHSKRHLIIFDRNRDNDVFYLSPHYNQDMFDIDRNDTLIDKLIHAGLRWIIELDKDPIDDPEPDIGDPGVFGPGTLDAIIYFLYYLRFTYINCNYKLLTAEVKRKFKFFINPDGVMGINGNIHPSGVLYKVINCNKGVGGMDEQLKHESVETGLRELDDRFAITPLHSSNYNYALKGEFLCDPETGGTGIRHNDGTITLIDEVDRKKNHIDTFEQKLILANIGRYCIYDARFDDNSKVKLYFRGENLLDNEILIERDDPAIPIGKVAFSIDTTILQKTGDNDILRWSNHDPIVRITYYTKKNHEDEKVYTQVASRLGDRAIEVDTSVLVISSIILELPENAITEDADNPMVESGDGIELIKGVTIDTSNYKDPGLLGNFEDTSGIMSGNRDNDGPDCICPDDQEDGSEDGNEGNGSGGNISTDKPPVDEPEYNDDDLYKPVGSTDPSEYTDPMRCIVHSVLIALKKGGLNI